MEGFFEWNNSLREMVVLAYGEDMAFSMAVLAIPYLLIYGWKILIRGFARLVNSFKSFSIPEKVVALQLTVFLSNS